MFTYCLLSPEFYTMYPRSFTTIMESSEFHTHTHIVTTHFCVFYSSGFQKQRIYKIPNKFLFSLYYRPNKGFQHDDDYANSNTLVSKYTVYIPYVLCVAAEETLLADARNAVELVKIRYKNLTFRGT